MTDWNERYASHDDTLWSGQPNGALVTELDGAAPGRALDVGCGEGADAIWLAEYVHPADVRAHLDDQWEIEVDETRPRVDPHHEGSPYTHDTVLRARLAGER